MFDAFKDPKKHCEYFKYLSMIATSIATLLVAVAIFLIANKKYNNGGVLIMWALFYMLSYFQNRLLYTMCKK